MNTGGPDTAEPPRDPAHPRRARLGDLDTTWARRLPARWVRAACAALVLRPLCAVFAPLTVRGRAALEGLTGPAVIAATHSSHADTMVMIASLPSTRRRRLVVAAAADYFFDGRVSAVCTALTVGAIPVDRDKVSRRTLDLCHRLLGEGWSLLIYPEGGRSADGTVGEFKPGAAWIARRAGVPVVPVLIDGTHRVLPKGRALPRRARVTVTFGAPLWPLPGEKSRAFSYRISEAVRRLDGEAGVFDLRGSSDPSAPRSQSSAAGVGPDPAGDQEPGPLGRDLPLAR